MYTALAQRNKINEALQVCKSPKKKAFTIIRKGGQVVGGRGGSGKRTYKGTGRTTRDNLTYFLYCTEKKK